MIVVDTNVLVQLLLPAEEAPLVEEIARIDDVWHAPALWRSEFRSVLVKQPRGKEVGSWPDGQKP